MRNQRQKALVGSLNRGGWWGATSPREIERLTKYARISQVMTLWMNVVKVASTINERGGLKRKGGIEPSGGGPGGGRGDEYVAVTAKSVFRVALNKQW